MIQKEIEQIQRRKCQEKGCPNKAESIYRTKFYCGKCVPNKRMKLPSWYLSQ